jgi:hypothetical protein
MNNKGEEMKRFVMVLLFSLVASGFAQTAYLNRDNGILVAPRYVNYQGYITDTLYNPITNPSLSMVFSIWNAASAGTQKWSETQSVAVDKGIFHVLLGNVTPLPDTVFTANNNRYLQISIGGTALSPRTRIVAAPYAYTSTFADTALYAANVATGNLDDRYVNVQGRDSIYANTPSPTFTVSTYGAGMGLYAWRDTTPSTNPVVYGYNLGSGSGFYGLATQDDNGSAGVIGRHANYRPGVWGFYGATFVSVPRVRAGVAAYSEPGPAFFVPSGSLMGVYVDTVVSSAFQVMQTGGTGYYVGSAGWNGVVVDSCNPSYTAIYANKAGYNGVGVNRAGRDGVTVGTVGRNGLTVNSADSQGVKVILAKNHGLVVDSATVYGLYLRRAGATGIRLDTVWGAGVSVGRADGSNGFYVNNAGSHGFSVNTAGMSGLYVGTASDNGVRVADAGEFGLLVNYSDSAGVKVVNSADDGVNIGVGDYGVYIDSTRLDGVYVRKSVSESFYADYGTYGLWVDSALYDGVYIDNPGDDGITVNSPTGDGIYIGATGARGLYISSAGTNGVQVANSDGYAVYGNSGTQRGGYFRNDNNTYYTLTAWNNTGTGGTVNGAYIQGHGYATGGWQTFLADGKTGFAPVSPDQEIIISGSSVLKDGRTAITVDPAIAASFSPEIPVRVIVTPTSECNGICVSEKTAAGFQVKELLRGKSAATFDWIMIARAKGYEKTIYSPPIMAEDPIPREPEADPVQAIDHQSHHGTGDKAAVMTAGDDGTKEGEFKSDPYRPLTTVPDDIGKKE